ncbi:MAG: PAS domain-containing protein, partial [Deltaproteobacteria bacterium]|nr:PAS domain-containing protein [Deltaproteobacteria bacterium]
MPHKNDPKSSSPKGLIIPQLDDIIQSIPVGIWVTDGTGDVITVNKASEKLSNFKALDFIGKNVQQLIKEGFMDISPTMKVLQSRKPENAWQRVQKTGKYLLVTSTPVFDDNGAITMVVSTE